MNPVLTDIQMLQILAAHAQAWALDRDSKLKNVAFGEHLTITLQDNEVAEFVRWAGHLHFATVTSWTDGLKGGLEARGRLMSGHPVTMSMALPAVLLAGRIGRSTTIDAVERLLTTGTPVTT